VGVTTITRNEITLSLWSKKVFQQVVVVDEEESVGCDNNNNNNREIDTFVVALCIIYLS
jgi:hypothetical protein